jgi:hypothetical protein
MENEQLAQMRDNWEVAIEGDGGHCPCCGRWGKIYKRALNASMARSLMWLVNRPHRGDGWTHVPSNAPTWMLRSSQLPTLHLWGLVESSDTKTKLASSGLWKPTQKGIDFANDVCSVPKYVYVYDNAVRGFEGPNIVVREALGSKYDYAEIMANYDGTASAFDGDNGYDA